MLYDLIVIGAGPAGYTACERAAEIGLSVLCIEKEEPGGVCLNHGCIPSKTLLHSAKLYDAAKDGKAFGVQAKELVFSHDVVLKRKEKTVKTLVLGVKAKLNVPNVTVKKGHAYIEQKTDKGYRVSVNDTSYEGKRLLIASGSSAMIPPIEGVQKALESGFVVTNKEVLRLQKVPSRMTVIGAGAVGLEMASYYSSAGAQVTVIEMLPAIGGPIDEKIASSLQKSYEKKGILFELNAKVVKVESDGVVFIKEDREHRTQADLVLLSVGRKPNTDDMGVENIGLFMEKGAIAVDERMRTNVAGVYACGDVTGRMLLAHVAYRQAEVCIHDIAGQKDRMRYDAVPWVIYTNPEVASMGMTEKEANKRGRDAKTVELPMKYSGRYVAETERGQGLCKLVVDRKYNTLLGVHMIGSYVSEIIYGIAPMMECEMTVQDIKKLIFPHPTVAEVIKEGMHMLPTD